MRIRLISGAAVVAAASLALIGCSSTASPSATPSATACTPVHPGVTTITPGALTVAQYAYPPFSMYSDGQLTGVEGEILTDIANMECLTITIVPGEAAAMITDVQSGRADTTLGSWYRTAARQQVVNLSDPIVSSPLALVSKNGATTVAQMKTMKIGAVTGLVGLSDLQTLLGDGLKTYPDTASMAQDFQSGRIDGYVQGIGAAVVTLQQYPVSGASANAIESDPSLPATQSPGQTNFPTNQANTSLGAAINDDLKTLRDSGELKTIAAKYDFPASLTDPGTPNLL